MAEPVDRMRRPPRAEAVARRDRGLRLLRRATALVAAGAAVSVGAVSAVAAATRPGQAAPPRPAAAPEQSVGPLRPPPSAPTEPEERHESARHEDDGPTPRRADPGPTVQQQQPAPAPAPAPPPVTSGGS